MHRSPAWKLPVQGWKKPSWRSRSRTIDYFEEMNMATSAATLTMAPMRPLGKTLALYVKEARYEFLKYLRLPIYSLSTVLFPIMFYVLFGLVMNRQGSINGFSVA